MQKPSIGRVVHYCHSGLRIPCSIEFVNDDGTVNLFPTSSRGPGAGAIQTGRAMVEESPESAAKPNNMDTPHGTWSWPPRVG